MRDYLRCIASVDDNVGRLLDYLKEAGLAENTVVIYASDQGFYLGEHGWYDKRWMYEESLRTPLVVRWPAKIKPGSVREEFVSNLDFAETFLELAGVEVPGDVQGRSLVPLLAGGQTPKDWRQSFYYHYYEAPAEHAVPKHYGIRTARYKLIHFYQLGEWELFDLEKDPHEMKSVYADKDHAAIVEDLKRQLADLRKQFRDDS
jgi:arylsulfatase A-like enzyme